MAPWNQERLAPNAEMAEEKKPFLPQTLWGKIVSISMCILLVGFIGLVFVPIAGGWRLVPSRSMAPTIEWQRGWPGISGYVHITKGNDVAEGDIVFARIPGRLDWQLKRVADRYGSMLWLSPDNGAYSGDGSASYGWVPVVNVIGVVDAVYDCRGYRTIRDLPSPTYVDRSPRQSAREGAAESGRRMKELAVKASGAKHGEIIEASSIGENYVALVKGHVRVAGLACQEDPNDLAPPFRKLEGFTLVSGKKELKVGDIVPGGR